MQTTVWPRWPASRRPRSRSASAEVVAVFIGARVAPLVAVGGVVVDTVPSRSRSSRPALRHARQAGAAWSARSSSSPLFAAVVGIARGPPALVRARRIGAVRRGRAAGRRSPGTGAAWAAAFPSLVGAAGRRRRALRVPAGARLVGTDRGGHGIDTRDVADRRRFLTARRGGARRRGGRSAYAGRRAGRDAERQRAPATPRSLPTPAGPAPALPGRGRPRTDLSPFVTSNGDFYRIDTALVGAAGRPGDVAADASTAGSTSRSRSPSTTCSTGR